MNDITPQMRSVTRKQAGFALTSELVLLSTVLVLGLTVGLVTMRDAITAEMNDVAEAVGALNQSYAFDGMLNAQETAQVDGSAWVDAADTNAGDGVAWSFVTPAINEASTLGAPAGPSAGANGPTAGGTLNPEP